MPTAPKNSRADATVAARLPVGTGESAWTAEEVAEVGAELDDDIARLERQIADTEEELAAMINERSTGAGRDAADVGSANLERDQGMSMAANLRQLHEECLAALQRLDAGEFGACETCGEPIGKGRLLVFPRARLCVACKQREERH